MRHRVAVNVFPETGQLPARLGDLDVNVQIYDPGDDEDIEAWRQRPSLAQALTQGTRASGPGHSSHLMSRAARLCLVLRGAGR